MRKLVIICWCCFTCHMQAWGYTINVVESVTDGRYQQALQDYFTLVYKDLGIEPLFVYIPSERGLDLVNQGGIDAEALRSEGIGSQYPNLVKVSTPVTTVHPAFFCLSEDHCQDNAESIYGVHRGFEAARSYCQALKGTCQFESSALSLAKLLERGMVSALFLIKGESGQIICELSANTVFLADQPAFDRHSFHYVNQKHRALVPQLRKAISEVNQSHSLDVSAQRLAKILGNCGKTLKQLPLAKGSQL